MEAKQIGCSVPDKECAGTTCMYGRCPHSTITCPKGQVEAEPEEEKTVH